MPRADMTNFSKTVSAAGTPEPLKASSFLCHSATVRGKTANTGTAHPGGSAVHHSTNPGALILSAGDSAAIIASGEDPLDLNAVYLDVSVNGEGVDVTTIGPVGL